MKNERLMNFSSTSENEQFVSSIVEMTGNINLIWTNESGLNPIASTIPMSWVVVALSVATSIPTTSRLTSAPLVDPKPSYVTSFTMLEMSRDFPYNMPTIMMTGL